MTADKRGNRGRGFDRMVLFYANQIVAHQLSGIVGIRELAQAMGNYNGWGNQGQPWSYGTMRRVLLRGVELGVMLPHRTLSQAASQRAPNYRARSKPYFPPARADAPAQGDPS